MTFFSLVLGLVSSLFSLSLGHVRRPYFHSPRFETCPKKPPRSDWFFIRGLTLRSRARVTMRRWRCPHPGRRSWICRFCRSGAVPVPFQDSRFPSPSPVDERPGPSRTQRRWTFSERRSAFSTDETTEVEAEGRTCLHFGRTATINWAKPGPAVQSVEVGVVRRRERVAIE